MEKQRDLLIEFEIKCRKELGVSVPQNITQLFTNGNNLELHLNKLKSQDDKFLPFLISLPFKQIHIFKENNQQNQSDNNKKFDSDQHTKNKIEHLETIIKALSLSLQKHNNKHLRSVKFESLPLTLNNMQIIAIGIQKTKYLKQLSFINCSLNDSHLEILKSSLSQNVSLNTIDFSFNNMQQIGQSIVQVLSKHGQRKRQILALHQRNNKTPQFNISNTGIYQLNFQGNQITPKSIEQIVIFLLKDQWIKSFNLKQNKLQQQQIIKFLSLLQSNHTLVNLDLRLNPGFNKKYSKIIFNKLKYNLSLLKTTNITKKLINIDKNNFQIYSNNLQFPSSQIKSKFQLLNQQEKIKLQKIKIKQFPQFNKQLTKSDLLSNRLKINPTSKILIKSPQRFKNPSNHHSHRKPINSANKSNEKQLSSFAKTQKQNQTLQVRNLKNTFLAPKNEKNKINPSKKSLRISSDEVIQTECHNCCDLQKRLVQAQKICNQMHIRTLKAQKQNLQLQIELKKLKCFIEKNRDVSVIGTSANKIVFQNLPQLTNQNSNISTSFNRIFGSENDEEIISRIQVLVTELTRIMQTVEQFQNTQNAIEHPFSNVNSFSKTVSLYERRQELMQIQQQILEDEALHLQQFGNESITLIQNHQGIQEKIQKIKKNEIIREQSESIINL